VLIQRVSLKLQGVKFLYDCVTGKRIQGSHGCIMADEMVIIIILLTTALSYIEDGCMGYPGASTVTQPALDSTCIMLP